MILNKVKGPRLKIAAYPDIDRAVNRVVGYWVTEVLEVDPDLVS